MAESVGSNNRTSSSGSMSVNNYGTNRPAPVPAINRDMAGAGPSKKRPKRQLDLNNPPPPDSSNDENEAFRPEAASAASGIRPVEQSTNKRRKIADWLSNATAMIFKKFKKEPRDD